MPKKVIHLFKKIVSLAKNQARKDEDPMVKIEEEILILKSELIESLKHLAEVKAMYIRQKKQTDMRKQQAMAYEKKAKLLLIKSKEGVISENEADALAIQALDKKDEIMKGVTVSEVSLTKHRGSVEKMEENTRKLKLQIQQWEQELQSLRARARISAVNKRMNERLMNVDKSNTERLFKQVSERVAADEALAESYVSINQNHSDLDDEINRVLGGTSESHQSLKKLKEEVDTEIKNLKGHNSSLEDLKKNLD